MAKVKREGSLATYLEYCFRGGLTSFLHLLMCCLAGLKTWLPFHSKFSNPITSW